MPWYGRIIIGGLYFFMVLLALTGLLYPLGADQGSFATGAEVLLGGGALYRDVWEQKGPACQLTYALVHLILGRNMWGIRALDLLFLFITAFFLRRFLFRIGGDLAAHTGTLFFCFTYLNLGFWHTAQPDGWAGMCLLLAWFLANASGSAATLRLFGAGLLAGWACQYKFLYAAMLLPLNGYLICRSPKRSGNWVRQVTALTGGFLVITALVLGWLQCHDSLLEHFDILFGFNKMVHVQLRVNDVPLLIFPHVKEHLLRYLITIPIAGWGVWRYWHKRRNYTAGLLLFWLTALLILAVQGLYHALYQWIPAYCATAIFVGLGIAALQQTPPAALKNWLPPLARRRLVLVLSVLLIAMLALPGYPSIRHAVTYTAGIQSKRDYYRNFSWREFPLAASLEVAAYINHSSTPVDTLAIWGFAPQIYYLAARKPASRFGYIYPLVASAGTPYFMRYRREFMYTLIRAQPLFIVICGEDNSHFLKEDSKTSFRNFPALYDHVRRSYEYAATFGSFDLYRLKGTSVGPPDA